MSDIGPGDRVLCINDEPAHPAQRVAVVKGQEYVVDEYDPEQKRISLVGVNNPDDNVTREILAMWIANGTLDSEGKPWYFIHRFRKRGGDAMKLLEGLLTDPQRKIERDGQERPVRQKEPA